MSLQVGIVGLPNVGKSTLFNALTKQSAESANFPFTTIDPNLGIVTVPDERLEKLAALSKSVKITPTTIEFVDIAGLVKNAHQGEGLGNQFLSHIREVDAIAHVVRFFEDDDIQHVHNQIDPLNDVTTIETELALSDLASIEKIVSHTSDLAKSQDKEAKVKLPILIKLQSHLSDGGQARDLNLTAKEFALIKNLPLLTLKPVLYIANLGENQIAKTNQIIAPLTKFAASHNGLALPLSIKIEQELTELTDEERLVFLKEYNLDQTGLDRLIKASYQLLNLITFLTTGPTESRAWTIPKNSLAPQAAGQIHTDMERGFIRAETVSYIDLTAAGSYAAARARGQVRDEGKEYVVQDGDVMLFKFSV